MCSAVTICTCPKVTWLEGSHDLRSHDLKSHDLKSHDSRDHMTWGITWLEVTWLEGSHDLRSHDLKSHDSRDHMTRGSHDLRSHDSRDHMTWGHMTQGHITQGHMTWCLSDLESHFPTLSRAQERLEQAKQELKRAGAEKAAQQQELHKRLRVSLSFPYFSVDCTLILPPSLSHV